MARRFYIGIAAVLCVLAVQVTQNPLPESTQFESDGGALISKDQEQEDSDRFVAFVSHHKTGTALNSRIVDSLLSIKYDSSSNPQGWAKVGAADGGWVFLKSSHGQSFPPYDPSSVQCLVHQTRHPTDIIVSGYLYHQRIGKAKSRCGASLCEKWLYEPPKGDPTRSHCPRAGGKESYGRSAVELLLQQQQQEEDKDNEDSSGLLCALEMGLHTVRQMVRMMKIDLEYIGVLPAVLQLDLDQWKDEYFDTTYRTTLTKCGMDNAALIEPGLRAYLNRKQRENKKVNNHINKDKTAQAQAKQTMLEWLQQGEKAAAATTKGNDGEKKEISGPISVKIDFWKLSQDYFDARSAYLSKTQQQQRARV